MIEFIFIILIIAIISSIAISKITKSTISTDIISCKNDFHIINLAIKNKLQNNIFKNNNNSFYLENTTILFSNILENFDSSSWNKLSSNTYKYILDNQEYIIFTYNQKSHIFICNKNEDLCKKVLN